MTKSERIQIGVMLALSLMLLMCLWTGVRRQNDVTLIMHMQERCMGSYKVIDGTLERQCGELIDQVQAKGYEVLSSNGNFWVEL